MDVVALTLWILYGLLAVVLPIALQHRRIGSTGLIVRGRPGSLEWFAGVGLSAGIGFGIVGSQATGAGDFDAPGVAGIGLFVIGLATTVVSQQWMGRSWRIGVDPDARTELVTHGPFAVVRNPIYAAMITVMAGNALMIRSLLTLAGLALLIASLEVQTRVVEEPYLLKTHGDSYAAYARRVGRFAPGVGRLG